MVVFAFIKENKMTCQDVFPCKLASETIVNEQNNLGQFMIPQVKNHGSIPLVINVVGYKGKLTDMSSWVQVHGQQVEQKK